MTPTRLAALTLLALSATLPAAYAAPVVPAAAAPAKAAARPSYVGVELLPVDAPTRALFKLPAVGGLLVVGVAPDSPADRRLAQGDILLKFDDQTLVNREQLRDLVRARAAGDTVTFTVVRGGVTAPVKVVLAEAAPSSAFREGILPEMFRLPDVARDMRETTRRALREAGHPESLLDAADDVVVLAPRAESGVTVASSRVTQHAEGTVTAVTRDGKTTVKAVDATGKVLVDGPLDAAARAALPEWAKGDAK